MPGSWAFSLEYRLQPARAQYTLKAELQNLMSS